MLCYLGNNHKENTVRQHFDWKGLRKTVHNVCKKCPTCQKDKTTNHKYGMLPPKQAKTNSPRNNTSMYNTVSIWPR